MNAVLAALVVLAIAAYVTVEVAGVRVIPGTSPAEHAEQRYDDVRAAAVERAKDVLTIDYKHMDDLQDKVLAGSTGAFKKQYTATRSSVKTSAKAAKAVAVPTIREVAVNRLSGSKATVYVAADLVRSNSRTRKVKATKTCPHKGAVCLYFRFKLGLTDTAGGWKLSKLEFVS